MKPLVKTVAGTAIMLSVLAGCASRSTGSSASSAAGAGGSTVTSGAPQSGSTSAGGSGTDGNQPGSTTNPAAPGGQPSSPGAKPGQPTSAPGGKPSAAPGQTKITSPDGVSLAADGKTLATEVEWGGCDDQPQLVVLSQDASKVVVEVKTTNHYRMGIMCPDIARSGSVSVTLNAPLGSRQVVDGVKNVVLPVH